MNVENAPRTTDADMIFNCEYPFWFDGSPMLDSESHNLGGECYIIQVADLKSEVHDPAEFNHWIKDSKLLYM